MDRTSGKPNPMKPGGATDPLEDVQGPKKPARPSDPKEYGTEPRAEETDVGEPGELYGSTAERRSVGTGLQPDSDLARTLHGMKRNEEPK
ncbi:hypothetical protein VUR80DRAFT_7397 [Thermomyces stellatus]